MEPRNPLSLGLGKTLCVLHGNNLVRILILSNIAKELSWGAGFRFNVLMSRLLLFEHGIHECRGHQFTVRLARPWIRVHLCRDVVAQSYFFFLFADATLWQCLFHDCSVRNRLSNRLSNGGHLWLHEVGVLLGSTTLERKLRCERLLGQLDGLHLRQAENRGRR